MPGSYFRQCLDNLDFIKVLFKLKHFLYLTKLTFISTPNTMGTSDQNENIEVGYYDCCKVKKTSTNENLYQCLENNWLNKFSTSSKPKFYQQTKFYKNRTMGISNNNNHKDVKGCACCKEIKYSILKRYFKVCEIISQKIFYADQIWIFIIRPNPIHPDMTGIFDQLTKKRSIYFCFKEKKHTTLKKYI